MISEKAFEQLDLFKVGKMVPFYMSPNDIEPLSEHFMKMSKDLRISLQHGTTGGGDGGGIFVNVGGETFIECFDLGDVLLNERVEGFHERFFLAEQDAIGKVLKGLGDEDEAAG